MKNSILIYLLLIIVVILSFFIQEDSPLFYVPIGIGCFIGGRQFYLDRKKLQSSLFFIKIISKSNRLTSIVIFSSIAFVVLIALVNYLQITIPYFKSQQHLNSLFLLQLLANYFQHFTQSIRCFKTGIKLPGRNKEIIAWNEITNFEIIDFKVTIEVADQAHQFNFSNSSTNSLQKLQLIWQKKRFE